VGSLNAISQFLHDVEEPGTNMPMLPPERPSNAAAGIARGPPSLPRAVAAEHIAAAVHDAELFAEQAVAAARQRTGGWHTVGNDTHCQPCQPDILFVFLPAAHHFDDCALF
jgi:hypothetical protein